MVGWHHQLNGYGFEQALGVGDGHGSLVCYSSWACRELDMTWPLNNKNRHICCTFCNIFKHVTSCNVPLFSLLIISLVNKCLFFSHKPTGISLDFSFLESELTPLKSQCVLFVIIALDFVAIRFVLVVIPVWLHYYLSTNTLCQVK